MTTHHFTLSRRGDKKRNPHRANLDIAVSLERNIKTVTQPVVNEIIAHVQRVEADPKYAAPAPYQRYPKVPS